MQKAGLKLLALALSFTIFFSCVSPAAAERQVPGEEKAELNQVNGAYGDVVSEKKAESAFNPFSPQMLTTGFLLAVPTPGGAADRAILWTLRGTAVTVNSLAFAASGETALWKNWPAGRVVFTTAPPEKSGIFYPSGFARETTINAVDWLANQAFSLTKLVVEMGINIILLAFNTEWTSDAASWVEGAVRRLFDLTGGAPFARLVLVLGICGLGVAVIARLLRGRLVSAVASVLIAACVLAAVFIYSANCGALVLGITRFTDSLAGGALAAATAIFPLEDQRVQGITDPLNRGLAAMGNAVWTTTVLLPWSYAEFGTSNLSHLVLTEEEWDDFKDAIDEKYAGDRRDSAEWAGKQVECRWLGRNSLEDMVKKKKLYLDTLLLALAQDDEKRDALLRTVVDPKVDHGEHAAISSLLYSSLGNASRHVFAAMLTWLPAGAFFLLAVVLAGSILFSQIALVLMLIFLPFVGLIALVPETGWSIALRYLQRMGGFFLIKVIYGLYLGAVLAFGTLLVKGLLK